MAGKLGLVAVDETGLKGLYDVRTDWKFDPGQPTGPASGEEPGEAWRSVVFKALQDQLGLKLVRRTITIQTIIVDHAEKAGASAN